MNQFLEIQKYQKKITYSIYRGRNINLLIRMQVQVYFIMKIDKKNNKNQVELLGSESLNELFIVRRNSINSYKKALSVLTSKSCNFNDVILKFYFY